MMPQPPSQQPMPGYAPMPAQQPVPSPHHGLPPELEKTDRARRRQQGFAITLLVFAVLGLGWPIVLLVLGLLAVVFGVGGAAVADGLEGFFAGALIIGILALIYVLTLPLIGVLALIVALRSHALHRRLAPYGRSAHAAIVVAWIAVGLSALTTFSVLWSFVIGPSVR